LRDLTATDRRNPFAPYIPVSLRANMFFFKEEERTINLHPSFFGPNITKYLDDQLLGDVEGTLQGDYFVVCVMQPHEYSDGKIVPGSSFAEFVVHYRAIVWKPFKGEVVCVAQGQS
jgi:DNA-directed RNA polymerase II subunit RPB7